MKVYLDSSALVAWFDPNNPHHRRVVAWRDSAEGVEFVTNRLLELECGHYFRQNRAEHAAAARQAYTQSVAASRFHRQKDSPLNWMRETDAASRRQRQDVECGFWDLCHVAAAKSGGWLFVTADRAQRGAADLEGLETVYVGPKA